MRRRKFLIASGVLISSAGCVGQEESPGTTTEPITTTSQQTTEPTTEIPEADFSLGEIQGPNSPVTAGTTNQISITVENTGDGEGNAEVVFEAGGTRKSSEINTGGGEFKTVEFDFKITEPGNYSYSFTENISGQSKSGEFEVLEPANFEYSDLQISPSTPEPGQDIEVSVRVENTGGVQGSDTVKFDVDGTSFNDTVSVDPGKSKKANISFVVRSQKQYEVSVGDLSRSFETAYDWAKIGEPYEAPDGLMVTLRDFKIEEMAGSYEYTIDYKLENPTEDAIDEGQFKLYQSGGGGESQTGFFGEVFPNEDVTRTYTFKAEKDVKFEVLAYHPDQFFSGSPPDNSIKWPVEY